jgi:hypothetical protein
MDLVTGLVNLQQASTLSQVQIAVAKEILDVEQQGGNAAIQLIEAAGASVAKAGNDVVAAATGLGGQFDQYA